MTKFRKWERAFLEESTKGHLGGMGAVSIERTVWRLPSPERTR